MSRRSRAVPYEPPALRPFAVRPIMKQVSRSHTASPLDRMEDVSLHDVANRFGTPVYVVSERRLREAHRSLREAVAKRYPDVVLAWSYKTHYLSAICSVFRSEGSWAEVVSGFEYGIAEDLGVPGKETIFNGPHKTDAELEHAFSRGSIVNLDSFGELDRVIRLARKMGRTLDVGLRLNMNLNYPPWDKFGFNVESGQAADACRRAFDSGRIRVNGLHAHLGTYVNDPGVYARGMDRMAQFAAEVESRHGATITYLDIGGGLASTNTLHSQFLKGEAANPTFDQYAEAICAPLTRRLPFLKSRPRLFLEAGRCLVDEAASLLTRVVSVKHLSNGMKAAIVDGGVHLLPTSFWYKHDIQVLKESRFGLEEYHLLGALCMQIDVIRTAVQLPPLSEGDLLVVRNVGAYNYSQSMTFIYPRPAWLLVSGERVEVIREGETPEYVRALDRLPRHLRTKETRKSLIVRRKT